jgi:hypothetical protein
MDFRPAKNDEIYLSSIKFMPSDGNTVGSHREPNQK